MVIHFRIEAPAALFLRKGTKVLACDTTARARYSRSTRLRKHVTCKRCLKTDRCRSAPVEGGVTMKNDKTAHINFEGIKFSFGRLT